MCTVQPITRSTLRVELTITTDFQWDDKVHGQSVTSLFAIFAFLNANLEYSTAHYTDEKQISCVEDFQNSQELRLLRFC